MHVVMFVLSSAAMAPKTRSADSPLVSPPDSHDPSSQQSSLVPTLDDTLALVMEQMALINARMDAQLADAAFVANAAANPTVAQRRRDAQREPPRDGHSVDPPTPPPPYPHLGYAPPT
jgi:hypothetical protein